MSDGRSSRSCATTPGTALAGGLLVLGLLAGVVLAVDELVHLGSIATVALVLLPISAAGAGALAFNDARRRGTTWWCSILGSLKTAVRWFLDLVL